MPKRTLVNAAAGAPRKNHLCALRPPKRPPGSRLRLPTSKNERRSLERSLTSQSHVIDHARGNHTLHTRGYARRARSAVEGRTGRRRSTPRKARCCLLSSLDLRGHSMLLITFATQPRPTIIYRPARRRTSLERFFRTQALGRRQSAESVRVKPQSVGVCVCRAGMASRDAPGRATIVIQKLLQKVRGAARRLLLPAGRHLLLLRKGLRRARHRG
jgi:hypothetical protein